MTTIPDILKPRIPESLWDSLFTFDYDDEDDSWTIGYRDPKKFNLSYFTLRSGYRVKIDKMFDKLGSFYTCLDDGIKFLRQVDPPDGEQWDDPKLLREELEKARGRIAELEEENRQLQTKNPDNNETIENLKSELETVKTELFSVKDGSQVKRVTLSRISQKLKHHGLNLVKEGNRIIVTYRYLDKVLTRQFKTLKEVWELLKLCFVNGMNLNEVLVRFFPQFSRATKDRLRRFFPTRTSKQLRPCTNCGFLINFKDRKPTNPNHTPHNCLGYVRGLGLTDSFFKEVMGMA